MIKNLLLLFIPIICIVSGCASYSLKVEQVQEKFAQGKYEDALKSLDKVKNDRSKLLYLMEKGTLLHYAGRYEESNDIFDQAEILAEDLYTKSISKEAGALFTSDNLLPYNGEKYERVFIHYYKAFNYIQLKLPESALVECRKVNLLLQKYNDESEGKSTAYSDDAFMQYLTGVIFEWQGELNDAFISYRKAEEAYEKYFNAYNIPPPSSLKNNLLRLSKTLGFTEEYDYYLRKYNLSPENSPDENGSELVLIYENGFAPRKDSDELLIPILKSDKLSEKTNLVSYSGELRKRVNRHYDDVELEYMLRVSMPKYISNRPNTSYMKLKVNGMQMISEMVQDIEAIAFKNFDERLPAILLKAIARGVTKYLTFRTAKKKQGEGLGLLVNIFNIATESADTRSWLSLPNNLQMVRMPVPSGKYSLQLSFYDKNGNQLNMVTVPDVEVKNVTLFRYRTFD